MHTDFLPGRRSSEPCGNPQPNLTAASEPDRGTASMLTNIVRKRLLPGFAILSPDGDVLLSNAAAREILAADSDGSKRQCLVDIHNELLALQQRKVSAEPSAPVCTTQSLVHWGRMQYGILGFWVNDPTAEFPRLPAVLIERITPDRVDVGRAESAFHLSHRETDVIRSLALGMTDKEIAMALAVSPETVRWYLKGIRSKLGVSTRTAILHKIFSH